MASARAQGEHERTRVLVRIKPSSGAKSVLETSENEPTITLLRDGKAPATFAFDGVLNEDADQATVFSHCASAVRSALLGINVAILAYGQTGSGKTYSMLGGGVEDVSGSDDDNSARKELDDRLGILPRALQCMFDEIEAKQLTDYSLHFSMMQVYNEKVYDLLQDRRRENPLQVREGTDEGHSVFVQGLSEYRATCREDVMALLHRGMRNRAIRSTDFNQVSSRSHMIFQARLQIVLPRPKDDESSAQLPIIRRAVLTFVDLAGSEKWRDAQSSDATRELTNINTSLSALANCIAAIIEPGRRHIPFRDSVLTRLLQDTLGGRARSLLLATVQNDAAYAEDTYSTLQFAARAAKLSVSVAPNEMLSDSHQLAKARREIQRLRRMVEELQNARSELTPRRCPDNKKRLQAAATASAAAVTATAATAVTQSEPIVQAGCSECRELQSEIGGLEQALANAEAELRAERALTASLRSEVEQLRQQLQQQQQQQPPAPQQQPSPAPAPSHGAAQDRTNRGFIPIPRPTLSPLPSPGFSNGMHTSSVQALLSSSLAVPSPTPSLLAIQPLSSLSECPRHGLKDCVLCRMMKPADRPAEAQPPPLMATPGSSVARSPTFGFKDECALHGLQACMLCRLREAKQGGTHASLPPLSLESITQAASVVGDSVTTSQAPPVSDGAFRSDHGLGASLDRSIASQRSASEATPHMQAPVFTTASVRSTTYEPEQAAPRNFSADLILDYSDKLLAELFPRSENRQQDSTAPIAQRHKHKGRQQQRKHDSVKLNKLNNLTTKDVKSPYATSGIVHARN